MGTAFHQGALDNFCALYAVVNAFCRTHALTAFQARRMFHDTLLRLAQDDEVFTAAVTAATDYTGIVHDMLEWYGAGLFPLHVQSAFADEPAGESDFWSMAADWLAAGARRTMLLRFMRYVPGQDAPVVRHWTAADRLLGDSLFLLDSSRDSGALPVLLRHQVTCFRERVNEERFVRIIPSSCLLLQGLDAPPPRGMSISRPRR